MTNWIAVIPAATSSTICQLPNCTAAKIIAGTTTDEVTSAVDALIAEKVDAVFTPTDNTIMTAELAIYEKFLNAKIPQYCGADSFALNGAFVGYGVDYTALGKMTADMVVQVLVDGKSPTTLPVATFDNGIAMINTDSCTALGYDLVTPGNDVNLLRAGATERIEGVRNAQRDLATAPSR